MFERPKDGERALVVHVDFRVPDLESFDEACELVRSAGGTVVVRVGGRMARPHPGTFIGEGKLEEIKALALEHDADLVVFDHELSPRQERNVERALERRVISRTGLILDIFAQRARTHEGKLQVELAQLQHMSTRLVRGWSHLDRQKGGIGMRGAGETQLELDQRIIGDRIRTITERLQKVRKRRAQNRRSRSRGDVATVAIVGYTNAGKSTLFNILAGDGVFAADQLFATLDPTLRRIEVPGTGPVIIADTVGFIRRLPHGLVEAFKATLEEVAEADLLLHVIDASDAERMEKAAEVATVLAGIGAADVPCIEVFNKVDLCPLGVDAAPGERRRVAVSARTGAGLDALRSALAEAIEPQDDAEIELAPQAGRIRAQLYARQAVRAETTDEDGRLHLQVRLPQGELDRLGQLPGVVLRRATAGT